MQAGGGGTPTSPMWGSIYYIIVRSGDLPGQKPVEMLGKRAMKEAVKGAGRLTRWGFRLLPMGEASYSISAKVGAGAWVHDEFMPQQALTRAELDQLRELAGDALDYLTE